MIDFLFVSFKFVWNRQCIRIRRRALADVSNCGTFSSVIRCTVKTYLPL